MAPSQHIKPIESPFLKRPELESCTVTDLAINWLSKEKIVHSISLPNELSVEAIEEHFKSIDELTDGKRSKFLIDPKLSSMQMAVTARKVMSQKIDEHISCAAFVIDQKFLSLAINIFFKMRKSAVPFRCFTNVDHATDWLNEQNTHSTGNN